MDNVPTQLPPVWLLDVDGVLNVSRPGWGTAPHRATLWNKNASQNLRWAPPLIAKIRSLHRAGTVEVRWATTWCSHAHELEEAMRLPHLVATLTKEDLVSEEVARAAKLREALSVLEVEQRALIWTDDDAIPTSGPSLERLRHAPAPAHLVMPQYNRGLRPEHLEQIEEFVESLSPAGA